MANMLNKPNDTILDADKPVMQLAKEQEGMPTKEQIDRAIDWALSSTDTESPAYVLYDAYQGALAEIGRRQEWLDSAQKECRMMQERLQWLIDAKPTVEGPTFAQCNAALDVVRNKQAAQYESVQAYQNDPVVQSLAANFRQWEREIEQRADKPSVPMADAATELYEALEAIVEENEAWKDTDCDCRTCKTLAIARAALAKVEDKHE